MSYLQGRKVFYDLSDASTKLNTDQIQVDQMMESFATQASDWRALASMSLGSLAYQFGKFATASRVSGIFSKGMGLTLEVAAFRSSEALLRGRGLGEAFEGKAFISTGLDFFLLKGAGKILEGKNLILTHAGQSLTMVLGHELGASLNFAEKEQGSFIQKWVKAEVSNLQMMAGMSLMGAVTGNSVRLFEKSFEIESHAIAGSRFPIVRLIHPETSAGVMASEASISIPLPRFEVAEIREWIPRVQRESFKPNRLNAGEYFDGIVQQLEVSTHKLLLLVPFMAEGGRNYLLRKKAYERAFRVIEEEILPLEKAEQLKALNQVSGMIDEIYAEAEDKGRSVRLNYMHFLESVSKHRIKRSSGFRSVEDIELSQETLYRQVTRGLSLAELQMIVEFGEFVNKEGYSTFAETQHAAAYQNADAASALHNSGGLEVVLKLKVPGWQMKVGEPYGDRALVHFNEASEVISSEMVTRARQMVEQATRYVAENKTIGQQRAEFEARFYDQNGREPVRKEKEVLFRQLDYMRMIDALNRVGKLPRVIENWFDESEGARPIGKLPAKYVLWEESLELNRRRYESAPERFQQDVLPLFEKVLVNP